MGSPGKPGRFKSYGVGQLRQRGVDLPKLAGGITGLLCGQSAEL
jgi:hypothetical protein